MPQQKNTRRQVEYAYDDAHAVARDMLQRVEEALHDLPAPDNDECPVNWSHVATVSEVVRRLADAVAFLEGTER